MNTSALGVKFEDKLIGIHIVTNKMFYEQKLIVLTKKDWRFHEIGNSKYWNMKITVYNQGQS